MKKLFLAFRGTNIVESIETYFGSLLDNVLEALNCDDITADCETKSEAEKKVKEYVETFCDEDDAFTCDENGNEVEWEEIDKSDTEYGWHSAGDFYSVWDILREEYVNQAIKEFFNNEDEN